MISARTQVESSITQTVAQIVTQIVAQQLPAGSKSRLRRLGPSFLTLGVALAAAGCGNNYRPVVSAINPVGPAGQPTKYAVAISNPGTSQPALVTIVDVSGDTVLVTPNIDANPYYLILANGFTGYTLHTDGSLNSFSISSSLQTRNILQTTLLPGSNAVSLYPQTSGAFLAEAGRSAVAQLQGAPLALKQEISTGAGTIYTVGISAAPRFYALSDGTPSAAGVYTTPGTAVAIDASTVTPTNTINVGIQPVYGIMTADSRRAFIMNKGSGTVSVINTQTNQLDTFTNAAKVVTSTIPVGPAPVWADFSPLLSEMYVLNAGNPGGPDLFVNGYTIASNVISFTTAPQTLVVGQTVKLNGFPTSTFLNGQNVTVSATGLTPTTFQAAFTHANVATTIESGVSAFPSFTVNSYSINAGAGTISLTTSAQNLTAGQLVTLGGFPTSTFLNGQTLTVSSTGLSATSFQGNFSHATASATEAGAGVINGSISIVSIPLCTSALYTDPNCDAANPVDAGGFGTVVATINVGVNPTVVGVLQDASQAYVANAGSAALGIPGSVSAISQSTETVVATIPASNAATVTPTDALIHGNPNFLAVTTGTPTGKVYVTAPNSNDMTIIRTDIDGIQTHISLQGAGVMVRTSAQ